MLLQELCPKGVFSHVSDDADTMDFDPFLSHTGTLPRRATTLCSVLQS